MQTTRSTHYVSNTGRSSQRETLFGWDRILLCGCLVLCGYVLFCSGHGFPPEVWSVFIRDIAGNGGTLSFTSVLLQSLLYFVAWLLVLLVSLHTLRPASVPVPKRRSTLSPARTSTRSRQMQGSGQRQKRTSHVRQSSARSRTKNVTLSGWIASKIFHPNLLPASFVAITMAFLQVAGQPDFKLSFPLLIVVNMFSILAIAWIFGEIGIALIALFTEWHSVIRYNNV